MRSVKGVNLREIYFHEDDYQQLEILPVDNLGFCLQQIDEVEKSSAENFDGYGFKDVYMRQENPSKLVSLEMRVVELESVLREILPKYDSVYTGYSSYRAKCDGVIAFGHDNGATIFFEQNEGVVTSIWVSDPFSELTLLPNMNNLLFVDWAWGFACPLREKEMFVKYIKERDFEMEEYMKRMQTLHKQQPVKQGASKKPWWKIW